MTARRLALALAAQFALASTRTPERPAATAARAPPPPAHTAKASVKEPAAITLTPVGAGRPVSAALFGVGDDWTLGIDTWRNRTQLDAIRAVRAGVTRFPGGACSNYWNLTDADGGAVVTPCGDAACANTSHDWCEVESRVRAAPRGAFATATFLAGPAAACVDSNVVIDLNLLHFDATTAPGLVNSVLAAAAAAGGGPLTRWELGNEYYLPSDWRPPQPYGCSPVSHPAEYARRSVAVVDRVRSAAPPGSKVAAMGDVDELLNDRDLRSSGTADAALPPPPPPSCGWNAGLATSGLVERVDAITLHDYAVKGVAAVAPEHQASAVAAWGHARMLRIADAVAAAWPGKKVWMTEFGITYGTFKAVPILARLNHGGVKAMHVVGRVLAAVADPVFEVLQYYSLGGQGWGAEAGMLRWAPDGSGGADGDAVAQVFAHVADVATRRGAATVYAVEQSEGAPVMPWGGQPAPPRMAGMKCLQAAAFAAADGRNATFVVVNRCNASVAVAFAAPSREASPAARPEGGGGRAGAGADVRGRRDRDGGSFPRRVDWTLYPCGEGSPVGFAPLPSPDAPFPWRGPLVPQTGSVVVDSDGAAAAAGPTVAVEGISVLVATVSFE